uniref:ABC transporter domain-containing protein n=1 Tax=Oryza rufipogon TaxID=4529 RepID=A0A0E0PQZ6_ORYRU
MGAAGVGSGRRGRSYHRRRRRHRDPTPYPSTSTSAADVANMRTPHSPHTHPERGARRRRRRRMLTPLLLKTTTTMATGSRRRRTRTSAVGIAGIKQQASIVGEPPSVGLVIPSALPRGPQAAVDRCTPRADLRPHAPSPRQFRSSDASALRPPSPLFARMRHCPTPPAAAPPASRASLLRPPSPRFALRPRWTFIDVASRWSGRPRRRRRQRGAPLGRISHAGAGGGGGGAQEERTILKGITDKVRPWEVLAVLGPSGSGKSTLVSILGGRLAGRHAGMVLEGGRAPCRAVQRRAGFVAQDDVLHPHLTVCETLLFCAMLRLPTSAPATAEAAAAEAVISELGLASCADTIVGNAFEASLRRAAALRRTILPGR